MVTHLGFIHRLKSLNHLVQHTKQYHMKVLLNSFHLNGHTRTFHPLSYRSESPCATILKQYYLKVQFNSFYLNGHTDIESHLQTH